MAICYTLKLRKFSLESERTRLHAISPLFEEQYEAIEKAIDEVAERISTLMEWQ